MSMWYLYQSVVSVLRLIIDDVIGCTIYITFITAATVPRRWSY